jgi:hypothetical protein
MTCIFSFCSLFKSYKPECVPEKVPAVNLQLAFRAVGKMNQFFQQAQLRLEAGHGQGEEEHAKTVTWNIDHGMKRVSIGSSLHHPPSSPCINALFVANISPFPFLNVWLLKSF